MDFKKILEEFLELRGWKDEIQLNENSDEWYVSTGVSIGSHTGRLIAEGRDKTGLVGIYIYYETTCKDGKRGEMTKLLNWINCACFMGNFECLSSGLVRWKLRFDCENAALNGVGLSQNVQHGWDVAGLYADAIISVAFTSTSADGAIAEFEKALVSD
jgi:hypothetical protein